MDHTQLLVRWYCLHHWNFCQLPFFPKCKTHIKKDCSSVLAVCEVELIVRDSESCTEGTKHVSMKSDGTGNWPNSCPSRETNNLLVALMKSARTKTDVLTVRIKAARVILGDLSHSPAADLDYRPIIRPHGGQSPRCKLQHLR